MIGNSTYLNGRATNTIQYSCQIGMNFQSYIAGEQGLPVLCAEHQMSEEA